MRGHNTQGFCVLCPRKCGVYRSEGKKGFCGIGEKAVVSSVGPHFGEESVLVGLGGSGTIFFAGCNLGCVFCQNFDISHHRHGREITIEQLAQAMLELQNYGCSNINLVTPTHVVAAIMVAIELAKTEGLTLPIVYNSGGYDSVETLKLLAGSIDIYMPDMKYARAGAAAEIIQGKIYVYGGVNYPQDQGAPEFVNASEVFNPDTYVWSGTVGPAQGRAGAGSVALFSYLDEDGNPLPNDTVWIIGGETANGLVSTVRQLYIEAAANID